MCRHAPHWALDTLWSLQRPCSYLQHPDRGTHLLSAITNSCSGCCKRVGGDRVSRYVAVCLTPFFLPVVPDSLQYALPSSFLANNLLLWVLTISTCEFTTTTPPSLWRTGRLTLITLEALPCIPLFLMSSLLLTIWLLSFGTGRRLYFHAFWYLPNRTGPILEFLKVTNTTSCPSPSIQRILIPSLLVLWIELSKFGVWPQEDQILLLKVPTDTKRVSTLLPIIWVVTSLILYPHLMTSKLTTLFHHLILKDC